MNKIFGAANALTSSANQEIISQHKPKVDIDNNGNPIIVHKFVFSAASSCHIKIDDDDAIYFDAEDFPLVFDEKDRDPTFSKFTIVEPNITFRYYGVMEIK